MLRRILLPRRQKADLQPFYHAIHGKSFNPRSRRLPFGCRFGILGISRLSFPCWAIRGKSIGYQDSGAPLYWHFLSLWLISQHYDEAATCFSTGVLILIVVNAFPSLLQSLFSSPIYSYFSKPARRLVIRIFKCWSSSWSSSWFLSWLTWFSLLRDGRIS